MTKDLLFLFFQVMSRDKRLTQDVQEGAGGGRGDVGAAQRRLALVIAAVADRRQADDQPAAEIPDPRVDQHPVLPPSDTHFDEGSGRETQRRRGKKEQMKREVKKSARNREQIQIYIPFQGYRAMRERWNTSVILITPLNRR